MMVESRFSMNSAEATISGIRRAGLPAPPVVAEGLAGLLMAGWGAVAVAWG
jgi:hypothetical protein